MLMTLIDDFFARYDADLNKRSLSFPFAGRSFRSAAIPKVPPSSVLESFLYTCLYLMLGRLRGVSQLEFGAFEQHQLPPHLHV
jgi:hypothetical protein